MTKKSAPPSSSLFLVVMLSGCGGSEERVPIEVRISLDESTCRSGNPMVVSSPLPETFSLDCGGEIGIFLQSSTSRERSLERCIDFNAQDMRSLRDLPRLLVNSEAKFDLPTMREGLELAIDIHSPHPIERGCVAGLERVADDTLAVRPSYSGRSAPLSIDRTQPSIDLSLACGSEARCGDQVFLVAGSYPEFEVVPRDLSTDAPPSPSVMGNLDILIGYLARASEDGIMSFSTLGTLSARNGAAFGAAPGLTTVPRECPVVITTERGRGLDGAMGSCYDAAYWIDSTLLDALARSTGLTLRMGSLIVGRLLDGEGKPVAGAMVLGNRAEIEVHYPSADFSGIGSATSENGYFVISRMSVPLEPESRTTAYTSCCDFISAWGPLGLLARSTVVTGIVKGVLMGAIIRTP